MKNIFFVIAFLLSGCTEDPRGKWLAIKETDLYDDANGVKIATVKKGSFCSKGGFAYGKVDRYAKVKCDKLSGWIIEDENLHEIK